MLFLMHAIWMKAPGSDLETGEIEKKKKNQCKEIWFYSLVSEKFNILAFLFVFDSRFIASVYTWLFAHFMVLLFPTRSLFGSMHIGVVKIM